MKMARHITENCDNISSYACPCSILTETGRGNRNESVIAITNSDTSL